MARKPSPPLKTYDAVATFPITKAVRVKARNREEAIEKVARAVRQSYGVASENISMWVPFLEGDQQ
jgi:hypothetical protein